jgi:outer membrane protein W
MLAPSVTFGYKFSKRIMANVDVQYSYFKTNIKYTEEKNNLFTKEKTTIQTIDYKKNVHTLSIGLGLIIQLKTKMY